MFVQAYPSLLVRLALLRDNPPFHFNHKNFNHRDEELIIERKRGLL
jgi:hypothetical protein